MELPHALSLIVTAFAQWRMARMLVARAGRRGVPPCLARALAALYGLLLAAGFAAGYQHPAGWMGIDRWLAAAASGAAHLWGYASTAAYLIYEALRFAHRRLEPAFDPGRRRLIQAAGGATVAAPFVAVGYGALIERTNFQFREVEIPLPHLAPDLDGLRIAHLSDIHLSAFLSERELAYVIDAANEHRPHVAVVTGDMISTRGDPLDACLRQIARLRAEAGVLGCMGNHEDYAGATEYAARAGARLGIRFLRGGSRQLRFGRAVANFAGVDYQPILRRDEYLAGAERMIAPGALNVLLSHNPDVIPVAAAKGYHLTLSGHTHGGQVTVEILSDALNPARFLTPYVYGLYRTESGAAGYVTRGVGTIGIPARIGAPPEVALIRLRKA